MKTSSLAAVAASPAALALVLSGPGLPGSDLGTRPAALAFAPPIGLDGHGTGRPAADEAADRPARQIRLSETPPPSPGPGAVPESATGHGRSHGHHSHGHGSHGQGVSGRTTTVGVETVDRAEGRSSGGVPPWIYGIVFGVAGVGIGLLISLRRPRNGRGGPPPRGDRPEGPSPDEAPRDSKKQP
jgi:hypothetical protein